VHNVLTAITGLTLVRNQSFYDRDFTIAFTIAAGSSVQFTLYFDNQLIPTTFSYANMSGVSNSLIVYNPGNHTANLTATNDISVVNLVTTTFLITYEPVTGVVISKSPGVCVSFGRCYFTVSTATGQNVSYTWTAMGSAYNGSQTTTTSSTYFTFPMSGLFYVNVLAFNPISSSMSNNATASVVNYVTGISFFAANPNNLSQSASSVNLNASFLFTLQSGMLYNCTVSFGNFYFILYL
jgi:hypothetical protein